MSKIKFNKVLNKKQYQAVTSTEGPYLVISSAGSGKTRILIYRVAYLIHNKKVDPSSILLLTFTRKAAMEMINRATALLDHRCRDVAGGTFHSFAFFTLKKYHKAIGYPRNFNIIDQSDSQDLIKLVTDSLGYFNDRYFPRKGTLSKIISKAINTSDTIRNVVEDEYPRMKRYIAKIDNLRKEYNKYKKIKALMDYDDLLVKLKLLLKKNPKIRKALSLKYKYIMVDEFQDTNNLQSIIIKYLSSEHNNIMVVGDFFQCWDKNSKVITKKGKKKVFQLKIGDKVKCSFRGDLKYKKVTNIRKQKKSKTLTITTKSNKKLVVTPEHKCFATQPNFDHISWYVYMMYRVDLGFRIGILSGGSKNNISTRTNSESPDRLWIIKKCKDEASASFTETYLSLKYKIPKTVFRLKGRDLRLNEKGHKKLFKKFGSNGWYLLEAKGFSFDFPNFVPQGTERNNIKRLTINLTFNQLDARSKDYHIAITYENLGKRVRKYFNNYIDAKNFAEELKEKENASIIFERFRIPKYGIGGQSIFLNVIPAIQLTTGMSIPVIKKGKIVLDKIISIEENKKSTVYNVEIAEAGNMITNGIISHNSIYAFRGANCKNIINFPKRFKHCKIITVERNYRSTQKILALGNEVVKYATEKYDKKMYSDINKGNKPIFYRTDNEVKQAVFIVNKIKKSKLPLEEIAVLFRSGHHSNILEVELKKNKIPFIKYGGMQFTELAHVKDLLSLLKVIYHSKDPISWSRVLRMIPGIGPKTTMNIIDAITERKYNYKALKNFQEANYWKDLQVLYKLIKSLKKEAKSVEAIVKDIIKYYKPYFENNYDHIKKREEDINSLSEISQEYSSALAMLNDLTLEPAFKKSPKNIEGKLTLSTIHSIKGLEMDTVFIINLVEGDLPSKYALDDPEQIEEERRLFYVAVTRAKNNLYLISPMSDADFERRVIKPNLRVEKDKTSNVSRFIKEIKNFDKIVNIHNFNPVHP